MDANKISRKGAKVKTTTADEHGFTRMAGRVPPIIDKARRGAMFS